MQLALDKGTMQHARPAMRQKIVHLSGEENQAGGSGVCDWVGRAGG